MIAGAVHRANDAGGSREQDPPDERPLNDDVVGSGETFVRT
jgi:hypothetical protein